MRGKRITDTQIERIKAVYAETGNIRQAARAANVPEATARRYVKHDDGLAQVRAQKRVEAVATVARERADFAELLADAREQYIRHLMTPEVMATADAKDAATIIGILTDKHQLITGNATVRTETNLYGAVDINDPEAAALARAYAARIAHGNRDAGDVRGGSESQDLLDAATHPTP